MNKTSLFIFAFLLCNSMLFSQSNGQKKNQIKGNKEFTDFSFIDAQKEYLKLAESNFRSEDLLKGLGDSYYYVADYVSASKWYKELYNFDGFDPESSSEYLYRYAQSLKSAEQYDEADKVMREYKVLSGEEMNSAENQKDYRKEIERNSGKYTVKNVTFNSSLSDFAPAY